jgi:hypothetical protein
MALLKKYQELKKSRKTEVEELLKEQAKKVSRNLCLIMGTNTSDAMLFTAHFPDDWSRDKSLLPDQGCERLF